MSLIEFLQQSAPPIVAARGRYVLQGQHSRTGQPVSESLTNLSSAVTRASELIGAGYVIDIWSPPSLESPSPSRTCGAAVQPAPKTVGRLKSRPNGDFGC